MKEILNLVLEIVINAVFFYLLYFIDNKIYERMLRSGMGNLHIRIFIKTCLAGLLYVVLMFILKKTVPTHSYEFIADEGRRFLKAYMMLQLIRFLGCFYDVAERQLGAEIDRFKQVDTALQRRVKVKIRENQLPHVKKHIVYILERIQYEAPLIPERALGLRIFQEEKKYYVLVEYYLARAEREGYEAARQELKECIQNLESEYEIKVDSDRDCETVKIYLEC